VANVVYTGFDPAFQDRLDKLLARAKAEGYAPNLISGVRSAYGWPGMKGQSQADLYSQLGKPGGPRAAAAPGYSPHQYGVASDVTGIPQSELERLAPEVGLRAIHGDPNHVELANWQQEAAAEPAGTPWSQVPNVPSEYAMNMEADAPVSHQPANLLNRGTGSRASIAARQSGNETHEQFIRDYAQKIGVNPDLAVGIANAEGLRAWSAQNPNAASYVDRTAGVPWSFGDFQLNTRNGMGVDALKAGVDPRDPNQWQAADRFALDQMKTGGVSPWKGDAYAANWIKSGQPITAAPGVMDPSAQARGSTVNPQPPDATAAAPPQNAGDLFKKLFTRPPPTKDANGNEVQAKSPLENLANSFKPPGGQQQAAAPQPATFAPVQDPMAGMAGPSSQMFQAVSQAAARPLSWTSTPYGSVAGQQYPGRGTTLNSIGGYYG
jgi:hypothetical protein